jgi:NNP family nitrate/nitrite transporter-like MFS transporter
MSTDITDWRVEDNEFWEKTGKRIANRNLWISIPCLLGGFSTWIMWSVITVQMVNLGFPYSKSQLFTLAAIAGFTGATLRIPSTFFIRIAGGRNTKWFTTALLMVPALGCGIFLRYPDTPLWVFQAVALTSGFGGGNFASSMSNISFFFPKKVQGASLGLNAGLGNFGVSIMQFLIPVVMTIPLFGALSGTPRPLVISSGTFIGKIPAGTMTYLQNAGLVWFLLLIPLFFLSFFFMNNLRVPAVSPHIGNLFTSCFRITWMLVIGFICAIIGLYFMLPPPVGIGLLSKYIVLPLVIIAVVMGLKYLTPKEVRTNLKRQYKIFSDPEMAKHTWAMTIIYTMTFGSFIGYSASFPLSIKVIYGFQHILDPATGIWNHSIVNPAGPSALTYAWIGPLIGALIRPPGGWISDKVGGALVTGIIAVGMVVCAIAVGYYMKLSYGLPNPEIYFWHFFVLYIGLFFFSGIGNGSTFRTIAVSFNAEQAGPVLGWTSAVAAYGAFMIPKVFGEQIKAGTPELAQYGFAAFYFLCFVINWWFYLRKNAYIKNP